MLALKTQLEDDEYALRLEKEGVSLRAKKHRMKDKVALKAAEQQQERLEEQVASAAMCTKNLGRQLRVQMEEAHMSEDYVLTLPTGSRPFTVGPTTYGPTPDFKRAVNSPGIAKHDPITGTSSS